MTTSDPDPYQKLTELFTNKQYRGCIEEAQRLVDLYPTDPRPHLEIGRCAVGLKDFELARTEFLAVAELNPDHDKLTNWLGLAASGLGRTDEAIAYLETTLIKHPKSPFALELLAYLASRSQDSERRAEYSRRFNDLEPVTPGDHHSLAHCFSCLGQYDQALAHYRAAAAIKPGDPTYSYCVGRSLIDLGRYDEAEAVFTDLVGSDPCYHLAQYGLGEALVRSKKYDDAAASFVRAIELAPESYIYRLWYGVALYLADRRTEAMCQYVTARDVDRTQPHAYHSIGDALYDLKDFAGAIQQWREALKLGYTPAAHIEIDIARALAYKGRNREALTHLGTLDHKISDSAEALVLRGWIHNKRNEYKSATSACRKAIELSPNHAAAHCQLGSALYRRALWYGGRKRWQEVRESYERAAALSPDDPNAQLGVAWVLQATGHRREAVEISERVLALHPDKDYVLYSASRMHFAAFHFRRAFELWKQRTMNKYRTTQAARQARKHFANSFPANRAQVSVCPETRATEGH